MRIAVHANGKIGKKDGRSNLTVASTTTAMTPSRTSLHIARYYRVETLRQADNPQIKSSRLSFLRRTLGNSLIRSNMKGVQLPCQGRSRFITASPKSS
jgi:hypothetical protein